MEAIGNLTIEMNANCVKIEEKPYDSIKQPKGLVFHLIYFSLCRTGFSS